MMILGIESSCDETGVALVQAERAAPRSVGIGKALHASGAIEPSGRQACTKATPVSSQEDSNPKINILA